VFTVRLWASNAPATWMVVGEPGDSVTSVDVVGTPFGFQLSASPQLDVPAPPSHVAASEPAVATTTSSEPGVRFAVETTLPEDVVPVVLPPRSA